ncbi:MAG TPA: MmcQ/YjbR family DNA-binding protein [Polyangia bacterium]|nr:MmcQ/YjbR family DNA-binding protein [Polyangia bacterium]
MAAKRSAKKSARKPARKPASRRERRAGASAGGDRPVHHQAAPRATRPESALRAFALSLPGAVEEFPWGDRVVKVNKKVFVFLGTHDGGLAMSVKLPDTAAIALTLPFASPTRYGLGKSGWVTALFAKSERPPLDMLRAWIEESYRAVAPARLVATLPARG